MECSLSSFTRNMAFGSSSITVPLNSIISSFDIRPLRIVTNGADHGRGQRQGQEQDQIRAPARSEWLPSIGHAGRDISPVTGGQTRSRSLLLTAAETSDGHDCM